MPNKKGSTPSVVNERIDLVADLLLAGKTKGEIKKTVAAKYKAANFRTVERDIKRARERMLEESSHVEEVVGLLNRLFMPCMLISALKEKGIFGRSAERIVEMARTIRDRNSQVQGAEAKAENLEAYRHIVRTNPDDRIKLAALQRVDELLGLVRIKIDMTLNEERELDELAGSIIAELRSGPKRSRLIENNGHSGNSHKKNGNGKK